MHKNKGKFSTVSQLAVLAAGGLIFGSVPTIAATSDGSEKVTEEVVVVSARRKDEDVQDVPLSVTVLGSDLLEAKNIGNLRDLNTAVPNITIGASGGIGGGSSSIFMRGIGQDRGASVAEPGVGVYIDGVFLGQADGGLLDLVDVERIEVLKGPQGTLFGKNAIGGLLHYISKKPNQEFGGKMKVTGGSYNRLDVEGSVNIPLTDTSALRFSALSKNADGHVTDVFDPMNPVDIGDIGTTAARVQLRLQPNDALDINFSLDYTRLDNNGSASNTIAGNPDAFPALIFGPVPGPPDLVTLGEQTLTPIPEFTGDLYTARLSADTKRDFEGYGASMTIDYQINDSTTFKSITGYREFDGDYVIDFDGSAGVLRDETYTRTHEQFQQVDPDPEVHVPQW